MTIQDLLDEGQAILDGLFSQLFDTKNDYKGRLGNARKVLKRKHRQNGLRIGQKYISLKQSLDGGLLLISKTGGGKSSKIFLQNLLGAGEMFPTNFVCLDPAKELRQKSIGYLSQELGYLDDVINFADAFGSSVSWNPIGNLPYHRIHRFTDELVAITSDANPSDPIWNNMASLLLSIIIRLLKLIGLKEYINLYNSRYLITLMQSENPKMDKLIAKFCDDMLFEEFKAFLNNDSKFLQNIYSSTLSVLSPWRDENVIKTTSSTTLNMNSYRGETPKVLYIQNDVMSQSYLKGINSLFLKEWFTHIIDADVPDNDSPVIAFLVDEASTVRTSDKGFIPLITSQVRKYRSYGIWGYQSYSQCENLLGKEGAKTLKMNTGCVLYLGKQNIEVAQEISRSLGKFTYKKGDKKLTREVLTADEIMHQKGAILDADNQPPIRLKRVHGYFEHRKQRERSEIPAPPISPISQDMPPLLPIDELIQ